MAKRSKSFVEDIFDGLVILPWWCGIIAAVVFSVMGQIFKARMEPSPINDAMRPVIGYVFIGLAGISLMAAVVSAIKSASRKKLLNRQQGIETIRGLSWREFEHLVGEAYRRKGYMVEETGGGGPDGGIDLVLHGNGEKVLVQCKRWKKSTVGVDKVREMYGILASTQADRVIFVTCGSYTNEAKRFAQGKPLELIDGPALAALIKDVQPSEQASTPPAQSDKMPTRPACPVCGDEMILRTAKKGPNTGNQFYGCSQYPKCRGTVAIS